MNIERLNINVNGKLSLGFNGDDAVFDEIALLVGGIPKEYIEFIKQADGGHPEINCFYPQGGESSNEFEIDWFYSLATHGVEKLRDAINNYSAVLGTRSLPIGRDGGGNQIYIEIGETSAPVWLYLHDENEVRLKISNSFGEFLDSLTMNADFI